MGMPTDISILLGYARDSVRRTGEAILATDSATGEVRSRALLLFVARSKTGAAAGKLKRHSNPTSLARGRDCSAPLEPGRLSTSTIAGGKLIPVREKIVWQRPFAEDAISNRIHTGTRSC